VTTPRFGSEAVNVNRPLASEIEATPIFCHFPLMFFCKFADLPTNLGSSCALIVITDPFDAETGDQFE
jgi:hypothetical protein